jgi:hypothetical protein|tara:strand:- start:1333 stop:1446 length:114 start_codon:yes stop_codon:yes gene_type:complete
MQGTGSDKVDILKKFCGLDTRRISESFWKISFQQRTD